MTKVSILLVFACIIIMTINGQDFFKLTLFNFCIFAFIFAFVYILFFFIIKKAESYSQKKQLENDLELLIERLNYELEKISCKQLRTTQRTEEQQQQ